MGHLFITFSICISSQCNYLFLYFTQFSNGLHVSFSLMCRNSSYIWIPHLSLLHGMQIFFPRVADTFGWLPNSLSWLPSPFYFFYYKTKKDGFACPVSFATRNGHINHFGPMWSTGHKPIERKVGNWDKLRSLGSSNSKSFVEQTINI